MSLERANNWPPTTFKQKATGVCPTCGEAILIWRTRYKRVAKQWTHWYQARCSDLDCTARPASNKCFTESAAVRDFLA